MKTCIRRMLMAAALTWSGTAGAQIYGMGMGEGGMETHAILTIQRDGSCVFSATAVETRTMAEQQLRMMEHYKKMSEGADAEATASNAHQTATNPPDASLQATNATAEPKPYTDEELTKKLTDAMNERTEDTTGDAGAKSAVEVNKDSVTFVTSQTYASIEEMLKESYAIWSRGGMYFENACFETDTNGLLRVTFTPQAGMERDMKNASAEWKLTGAKSELKLVFPGKVVSSGFPAMDTNATWVLVDGKQSETVEAMAKLYAAPTVITAEAGGLKLDQPLESKKLIRARRHPGADNDDLPITDAGPGFAAEAQSVTTTMLHVFPGGEDYFKNGGSSGTQTGAVVNAKLFAPKGRTLQSVSDVRVLKAVDDKGRSVVAEEPADEENDSSETFSRDSQDTSSLQVQLHLQLPQPDAQSIDTISAEAVAMTVGTWKEMTLTNLQENATNETDLAAVLPGAKLVIIKNSSKKNQIIIQARIKGPRAVSRLEVHAKKPGNEQFNSSTSERSSSAKGTESTRNITIQGYDFGDGGAASPEAVILTIRYPEDQKRERVKFELKSLDLL